MTRRKSSNVVLKAVETIMRRVEAIRIRIPTRNTSTEKACPSPRTRPLSSLRPSLHLRSRPRQPLNLSTPSCCALAPLKEGSALRTPTSLRVMFLPVILQRLMDSTPTVVPIVFTVDNALTLLLPTALALV